MEDQFAVTNQNIKPQAQENDSKGKLIAGVLGSLAVLILVATGAYYAGTKTAGDSKALSPTPQPNQLGLAAQSTPTPSGLQIPTVAPSPTPSSNTQLTPTNAPLTKTKTLAPISELDGFRSSNNGGNNEVDIRTGRNLNLVSRGFASFDLNDLPKNATIQEANLRLYQAKIVGSAYDEGGKLKVDHLTYGDTLDSEDYAMAALTSSFVTLSTNAKVEWKEADVTARLKDDIANARSMSQFRIHFETENTGGDTAGDFAYFESADNSEGTGNIPQLVVKYY